jgi:ubiquinone/menaquinone biosynthesis C-methylase UbiE
MNIEDRDDQGNLEDYRVGLDGSYKPYNFWLSLNGLYDLYAFSLHLLGDLKQKKVLDCGCGRGHTAVMLAKHGAEVTAFDLSEGDIAIAKILAEKNQVNIKLSIQRIEAMNYDDSNFDGAFGSCILHHVDIPQTCKEINRVLRPDATAVFIENSARNVLLMLARKWLVGSFGIPKYGDDDEEHPLTSKDIDMLKEHFPGQVTVHHPDFLFFRLLDFYILQKRSSAMTKLLRGMDLFFGKFSCIRQYSYFQVIELKKQI